MTFISVNAPLSVEGAAKGHLSGFFGVVSEHRGAERIMNCRKVERQTSRDGQESIAKSLNLAKTSQSLGKWGAGEFDRQVLWFHT